MCSAIANLAMECGRRGVYVKWRRQQLCREYTRVALRHQNNDHSYIIEDKLLK